MDTSNLEKGITVPPEVYNYLYEFPGNVTFLLQLNGKVKEFSGQEIINDVTSGTVNVYPKAYLLKISQ